MNATSNLYRAESFLRSINIVFDADHADRLLHFQPTTKSIHLIKSLIGWEKERTFFIVAPYGSGKSLTLAYFLHLLENRESSKTLLKSVNKQIISIDPMLARAISKRYQGSITAVVAALSGSYESLPKALYDSIKASIKRSRLNKAVKLPNKYRLDLQDVLNVFEELSNKQKLLNISRISILWDEFGRHLEKVVSEGQTSALNDLQVLAEYVSRSRSIQMTLGLVPFFAGWFS